MKFVFTGDPRHGSTIRRAEIDDNGRAVLVESIFDASNPLSMIMFGKTFELDGEPQEVTEGEHIAFLRAHSHFTEVRPRADTGDSP